MSSFTPRAWKSQPGSEAEHRVEPPLETPQPRDVVDRTNLPGSATAFIGRERDVADVKELLRRHRLVTLVGSGGVGKTRLALQVGTELLDDYPDGVWFVYFAPIGDPELVSSVTAQALGMSQQEGRRVDESIPLWLKRKKLLLIFDNCEHVLETVASLADAIVKAAQDVRMVTTSRQALDVAGEKLSRLESLDVPHSIADLTPAGVMGFDAVALFVDRALLVDKSFVLTDDTAPIVAEICRRLDGIPLAIELAAARVKVLSVPHLAERLNERFKILIGGSRSALPRQKTLTALLDWSYDLLAPQEQLLFARLGIFAGGFGLEAATSVCSGDGLDEIAAGYTNIAGYRIALEDLAGARDSAREGLRLARQAQNEQLIAVTLQHLALLAALGDTRRSAQLLGYVDAQYTALGMQREPTERWGYDKLLAALRETLSLDDIAALGAEGAAWSDDRAVEEALKV